MAYAGLLAQLANRQSPPLGAPPGAAPVAPGVGRGQPPPMPGVPPPPTGVGAMPVGMGGLGGDLRSRASAAVAALTELKGAMPAMAQQIDAMINAIVAASRLPGGPPPSATAGVSPQDLASPPPPTAATGSPASPESPVP